MMELKMVVETSLDVHYIEVRAGVRYWEDAILNGKEDKEGIIPLRAGDYWCPVIELETGRVIGWPPGNTADIHYKVCDDGSYFLLDSNQSIRAKWKDSYVPDSILCVNDSGYGDYIIFTIGEDGFIKNWSPPVLYGVDWDLVP